MPAKWVGRCPECGTWGTVAEVAVLTSLGGTGRSKAPASAAVPISAIDPDNTRHVPTTVSELDRVLGGGLVPGSVVLLAGEPGVHPAARGGAPMGRGGPALAVRVR